MLPRKRRQILMTSRYSQAISPDALQLSYNSHAVLVVLGTPPEYSCVKHVIVLSHDLINEARVLRAGHSSCREYVGQRRIAILWH